MRPVQELALLCRISLAVARCDSEATSQSLRACADCDGLSNRDVEEAILQSIPYSGFPGAVDALGLWRECSDSASASYPVPELPIDQRRERGRDIFEEVYGRVAPRVRSQLRKRHPDLERYILEFAYGRVMGRGAFELGELEALAVASLIGQGRLGPLHSHMRGALRCGWQLNDLRTLLDSLEPHCEPSSFAGAVELLRNLA